MKALERLRTWFTRFDPDGCIDRAIDLDLDSLVAAGRSALILDLENTLVRYKAETLSDDVVAFLDRAHGLGLAVGVVSNSPRSWVKATLDEHDIPFVGMAAKPRRSGFMRVLGELGVAPSDAVHVGDQIITDVYGGHRLGMQTIYVSPIGPDGPVSTHIQRRILMPILRAVRHFTGAAPTSGVDSPAY